VVLVLLTPHPEGGEHFLHKREKQCISEKAKKVHRSIAGQPRKGTELAKAEQDGQLQRQRIPSPSHAIKNVEFPPYLLLSNSSDCFVPRASPPALRAHMPAPATALSHVHAPVDYQNPTILLNIWIAPKPMF
jgi:hypothetical protein